MSNFAKLQEMLKKKKAALKGAGRTIKPKQGQNRYVLLPSWRGGDDVQFWHDFASHYIKDTADQIQAVYICTSETFGRPCAICDGLAEVQRTQGVSDPAVAELVKEARASTKYLVNVLALDSDTPDVPQVLELGKMAFGNLVNVVEEWAEQVFDPSNPQIIIVERTGTTTTDTKYTVQPSPKRHTFKSPVTPINLDDFVAQESEEMQKKALNALRSVTSTALPSGDKPRLAAKPVAPKAPSATDADFEDIPDSVTAPAPADKEAPWQDSKPAAQPAMSEDLDSLLAEIEAAS